MKFTFRQVDAHGRKDHKGQELKAYEVLVDGESIGFVFHSEHEHYRLSGRIRIGSTYSKEWGYTTRAITHFPECPRIRGPYGAYRLVPKATRADAAEALFDHVTSPKAVQS